MISNDICVPCLPTLFSFSFPDFLFQPHDENIKTSLFSIFIRNSLAAVCDLVVFK